MSREAAELARKAAVVMRERGQSKGSLMDDEGRVCLTGALCVAEGISLEAVTLTPKPGSVGREVYDAMACNIPYHMPFPWAWNDSPKSTSEDVQKAFLQVADELELMD